MRQKNRKGGVRIVGLKDLRTAKGWSIAELARKSGVHQVKISDIERGKIDVTHIMLRTAQKLANALEVLPEELLKPDEQ